jgi:hypothetical protein
MPLATHFGDDDDVSEGRIKQHISSMNSSQCDGAFHSEIGSMEMEYLTISWGEDARDRGLTSTASSIRPTPDPSLSSINRLHGVEPSRGTSLPGPS